MHLEGGEEFDQAVLEGGGHASGVGVEEEASKFAEDRGVDGGFVGEHDGIAAAAHGERRGRGPALGILEDENADGLRRLEVVFADEGAEGVAEFLEADHGFLAGFLAGVGEDLEGAGGVADPMVGREEGLDDDEEEGAAHASFYYGAESGGKMEGLDGAIV